MRGRRLATMLARVGMGLGLALGAAAIVVWALDIRIDVPPWMWRIAVVKLVLAAGLGWIAAGALILRHLRRSEQREEQSVPDEQLRALGAPSVTAEWRQREQEPQRITTPPEPHTL